LRTRVMRNAGRRSLRLSTGAVTVTAPGSKLQSELPSSGTHLDSADILETMGVAKPTTSGTDAGAAGRSCIRAADVTPDQNGRIRPPLPRGRARNGAVARGPTFQRARPRTVA